MSWSRRAKKALLILLLIVPPAAHYGCKPTEKQNAAPKAEFVTTKVCAGCHAKELVAWRGSNHDRAMQEASDKTVLGNFTDAKFSYAGIGSTFFKRDGKFFVNTDGPDGKLADYEIKYTFGVSPLQQYLIQFPGGRLQALSIAWDSRPKSADGQRWFHLYPKERITHKDPLHWTGIDQNWNYQCAECHSTNLQKRYDATKAAYDTKWSEINVACEACHGPGSAHVEWAKKNQGKKRGGENNECFSWTTPRFSMLTTPPAGRWERDRAWQPGFVAGESARPLHANEYRAVDASIRRAVARSL